MSDHRQSYLGDAVYYEFDGHGVDLTTSNGLTTTNRIFLEPEVIVALLRALAADFDPAKLVAVIGAKP